MFEFINGVFELNNGVVEFWPLVVELLLCARRAAVSVVLSCWCVCWCVCVLFLFLSGGILVCGFLFFGF